MFVNELWLFVVLVFMELKILFFEFFKLIVNVKLIVLDI